MKKVMLGILLLSWGLVPAQGNPVPPAAATARAALEARAAELAEKRRRIEEARLRIDLGLPVDPAFLRSLAPPAAEDPRALRARFARELDKLAALQARWKDLKSQAAKAPARAFRKKRSFLPAELKPRPAPPGAAGRGKPPKVKAPEKVPAPVERKPARVYRVEVDPGLLAEAFYRKGKFAQALALYKRILAAHPGDTAALFREALCLERTGKPGEALKVLAEIKTKKAGTPWEKAASFAEECILWKKNFDALGPMPAVPEVKEKPAAAGAGR